MKRTQIQRYSDIFAAYREQVGHAFTKDELGEWMIEHDLLPVPAIRSSQLEQDNWEIRFAEATK